MLLIVLGRFHPLTPQLTIDPLLTPKDGPKRGHMIAMQCHGSMHLSLGSHESRLARVGNGSSAVV